MKKLILLITVFTVLVSCKSTKYSSADCYKTQYKPLKAEKHKHVQCDAYN
jgi:hypothetical protein